MPTRTPFLISKTWTKLPSPLQATRETLRARVARPLPSEGLPADDVVQELVRNVDGGLIGSAGGRFYGWVIGGVLPAALAADWLTSAWQQNGALYATSPASAIVEETVGEWLKDILSCRQQFCTSPDARWPTSPSRRCASFTVGKTRLGRRGKGTLRRAAYSSSLEQRASRFV